MRAYLVTTAVIFSLITLAHVLRTVAEWSRLRSDLGFLIEGPGIGLVAAVLALLGLATAAAEDAQNNIIRTRAGPGEFRL
jgi:hypothetical protein